MADRYVGQVKHYALGSLEQNKRALMLRWECLRRRKSYQEDFATCYKDAMTGAGVAVPTVSFYEKHHISPAINPRFSFADLWQIITSGKENQQSFRVYSGFVSLLWRVEGLHNPRVIAKNVGVWASRLIGTDYVLRAGSDGYNLFNGRGKVGGVSEGFLDRIEVSIDINMLAQTRLM